MSLEREYDLKQEKAMREFAIKLKERGEESEQENQRRLQSEN